MSLELLEKFIEEDFGYRHSGDWGKSLLHDSLVVNRKNGTWFWNSRGWSGNTVDYLVTVRGMKRSDAIKIVDRIIGPASSSSEESEVVPYERLVNYLWENGKHQREYWYYRCLTDATIDRFSLGYFNGWYTIPVYVDGKFQNFQCRRDKPSKMIKNWYHGVGSLLFNADIIRFVDKIYITEGPVDSMILTQLGLPSVSHTNGANCWRNEWFKYFINVKEIVYIADNDEAGMNGAEKVSNGLGNGRTKILQFTDKDKKYDAGDFFREGGTLEEFFERESEAKYIFEMEK